MFLIVAINILELPNKGVRAVLRLHVATNITNHLSSRLHLFSSLLSVNCCVSHCMSKRDRPRFEGFQVGRPAKRARRATAPVQLFLIRSRWHCRQLSLPRPGR